MEPTQRQPAPNVSPVFFVGGRERRKEGRSGGRGDGGLLPHIVWSVVRQRVHEGVVVFVVFFPFGLVCPVIS